MMRFYIDGDIVVYRVACAVDNNINPTREMATYNIDAFMAGLQVQMGVLSGAELCPYEVWLTGDIVFREEIAKTAPYKGNRDKPRPTFYHECRQHLIDNWGARYIEPLEADDMIAIKASEDLENNVIMSLDKDFDQVPCRRVNFVSWEMFDNRDPLTCLRTLYKQALTGDAVDNIIGVDGIGPDAASMLIDNLTEELDMALVCIDQLGTIERFMENMMLVYLLRSPDDYYVPPSGIYDSIYYCNMETDI